MAKLSIGIVGLPNVGKSTLFNALTEKSVPAENYPFCTIDPSVGVVGVPDKRLNRLRRLSESEKTIPAAIEFVDIAGLVKGAAEGEGLGNQFLANIREADAVAHVVRIFEDGNIGHVSGGVDPMSDIETINLELMMADLQTVSKHIAHIEKDVKRGDKEAIKEKNVLDRVQKALEDGNLASSVSLEEDEVGIVQRVHLLSFKPMLYVLNKKAGSVNLDEINDERFTALKKFLEESGSHYVVVDAGIEQELAGLEGEERDMFRQELNVGTDDGVSAFIQTSYALLGLITFFTTGPEETRGWTIPEGATAPEAGAAIHTDFRDKFIRADVIYWQDLIDAGSKSTARDKGLIRTEGKEYVVKDGDVVEFKI